MEKSKTFNNDKYEKCNDIEELVLIHSNCLEVEISKYDIVYLVNNTELLAVCLHKNHAYKLSGLKRWGNLDVFDKDEITHIVYKDSQGLEYEITVPFKNISTSGSFNLNEKSCFYENDDFVAIEWIK